MSLPPSVASAVVRQRPPRTRSAPRKAPTLAEGLRHMLEVLEGERQALAGLDLDGIMGAAQRKHQLCGWLQATEPAAIDAECRGLLDAARRLNDVNRQLRNLIAANVAARLEAITGSPALYRALPVTGPAALTPTQAPTQTYARVGV